METRNNDHDRIIEIEKEMHAHEIQCEERWKTIFKETGEIKDEISSINKTMRVSALGLFRFAGALIIALLSGILPLN